MKDLDNCQTEAVDIMSEIIREAFLIDVEKTELDHYTWHRSTYRMRRHELERGLGFVTDDATISLR